MLKPTKTLRDDLHCCFTLKIANNKGADQTTGMHRLVSAFVVRKHQSGDFSRRSPDGIEAQAPWPALHINETTNYIETGQKTNHLAKPNDFFKSRIVIQSGSRNYQTVLQR